MGDMAVRAEDVRHERPVDEELLFPISEAWWDAFELPPGVGRAEVIKGELVLTPSPGLPHGVAATRLTVLFDAAVPEGLVVVQGIEWTLARQGLVAAAPVPDLVVVDPTIERITDPPVLAIEILSRSDSARLVGSPMTRIEGKLEDYADNGLEHFLEVDLLADPVAVRRYGRAHGRLVPVDRSEGDEVLVADVPFPYEIAPATLLI
jgi:Uma2 family endonuclease